MTTPTYAYAYMNEDGSIRGVQIGTSLLDPVPAGMRSVPVGTNDLMNYFDGHTLCTYTDDEIARRQARPSSHHTWSIADRAWIDTRTLDQVRADVWDAIKMARGHAIDGVLVFEGNLFQVDAASRASISEAADVAVHDPLYSDEWTTADNQTVDLAADQLIALQAAVVAHVSDQHAIARGLRAQIYAPDATREQLLAITWP